MVSCDCDLAYLIETAADGAHCKEALKLKSLVADRTNQVITLPLLGLTDVDVAQVDGVAITKETQLAPSINGVVS
jgi:hypothetical protein